MPASGKLLGVATVVASGALLAVLLLRRQRRDALASRPPAQWWRTASPDTDRNCYPTKSQALRTFLDTNSDIVENYGGADYEVSPSEFDAINHRYSLYGKNAARTIATAVWAAMPEHKPYCLDRIDIDALNDTRPAHEAGVNFRLPDTVYESQMAQEEARYYAAQDV
jgi:hypothetical protein